MLNPNPSWTWQDVGGAWPCAVLDDVLTEPQALVDLAAHHRAGFASSAGNAYPGVELPLPAAAVDALLAPLAPGFASGLGLGTCLEAHGRLALVTHAPSQLAPIQRVCHRDRLAVAEGERAVAAVLYLFDPAAFGGTCFFQPRWPAADTEALMVALAAGDHRAADHAVGPERRYLVDSCDAFACTARVPPRWNRLIVYDGFQFHNSHIRPTDRLRDDPRHGRLTLNLFMRYRTTA